MWTAPSQWESSLQCRLIPESEWNWRHSYIFSYVVAQADKSVKRLHFIGTASHLHYLVCNRYIFCEDFCNKCYRFQCVPSEIQHRIIGKTLPKQNIKEISHTLFQLSFSPLLAPYRLATKPMWSKFISRASVSIRAQLCKDKCRILYILIRPGKSPVLPKKKNISPNTSNIRNRKYS